MSAPTSGSRPTLRRSMIYVADHAITDLSRTTRWRLMKQGLFPAMVSLSPNRGGCGSSTNAVEDEGRVFTLIYTALREQFGEWDERLDDEAEFENLRLCQMTEELLDKPEIWRAISALAQALIKRHELGGNEAADLPLFEIQDPLVCRPALRVSLMSHEEVDDCGACHEGAGVVAASIAHAVQSDRGGALRHGTRPERTSSSNHRSLSRHAGEGAGQRRLTRINLSLDQPLIRGYRLWGKTRRRHRRSTCATLLSVS